MGGLSDRQRESLAVIAEKTEALSQLVIDILSDQGIDAASLDLQEFDLRLLFDLVLANPRFKLPHISLECDLSPDLPNVRADASLVERALLLLLDNAVKFSPDGGLIALRARPEGGMMHIEVQDQGIGIPADAIPNLFTSFYQVDGSTTRRFGGAGLGLSIVKRIVTAHDGQVGVHSVEREGSTFYFTLPLAPSPDGRV